MKQYQINRAYSVLKEISNAKLPVCDAYKIYMLMKQIEPAYEFELEQEKKLITKYNGEVGQDGTIRIKEQSDMQAFMKELKEMNDIEFDEEIKVAKIKFDSLGDFTMKPADIKYLDGFVEFI